jgi:hypothetical protein
MEKVPFPDNGGKRRNPERRKVSDSSYTPERRSGKDRRSGRDRRQTPR